MKKTISLLLTVLMAISIITVAGSASAVETAKVNGVDCKVGATVTYTFDLQAPGMAEDFQGKVTYSEGLLLQSVTLSETAGLIVVNDKITGVIYYSGSDKSGSYDFTAKKTLVTAKFKVTDSADQTVSNTLEVVSGADGTDYKYHDEIENKCQESENVVADFVALESVKLNKTVTTIITGNTETFTATLTPAYATNSDLTWTTSDPAVATVAPSGDTQAVVTAVAPGQCTLTVQCGELSASCEVKVADKAVPVTEITANALSAINIGKTAKIAYTVAPENATNSSVQFTSSDTAVATVNSEGVVTALKKGTATITIMAKDGSGVKTEVAVTVKQPVTKITLSPTKKTLAVKKTVTIKATVAPSSANTKSVTWKSSNTKVAKVDSKGKVTALKKGTATITATAKDGSGVKAKCTITVTQPVTKVAIKNGKKVVTGKTVKVKKGKKVTLTAVCTPSNANNKKVTWKTSKKTIATVTSAGKVTAKKVGSATITATAKDGSKKSAKVTIKVTK